MSRGGLVQAAGLAAVAQARRTAGDAVAHLVPGHVQRHQRTVRRAVAVAVPHAEAGVAPGRVHVRAVVHERSCADAVVADAVAAVDVLVVVPGLADAVVGVDAGRLRVRLGAIAPDVVGVGEDRRAGGRPVVGLVVAAQRVDHRVRAAVLRRRQRHGAVDQPGARAVGVLLGTPAVEHPAALRVDVRLGAGRLPVGGPAGDVHLVGQPGDARVGDEHDQPLAAGLRGLGGSTSRPGGHGRLGGQAQAADATRGGPGRAGLVLVDDEVAADHVEAPVGPVEADVAAAVGVHDDVANRQVGRLSEVEAGGAGARRGDGRRCAVGRRGGLGAGQAGDAEQCGDRRAGKSGSVHTHHEDSEISRGGRAASRAAMGGHTLPRRRPRAKWHSSPLCRCDHDV